jgi:hypothetical protein
MKKVASIGIIILIIEASLNLSLAQTISQTSTKKVLFSLSKGEKPVANGSFILISPIGKSITVITTDQEEKFFVYEDNKKRGPYYDLSSTGVKFQEDNPEEYFPVYRKDGGNDLEQYVSSNTDGLSILKIGNKTYGPFQFILEFYASSDKKNFSAIVMKEGKPNIISSGGTAFEPEGQPGFNSISPSGNKMMVTTISEKNNKPAEAYIYFQDGKKFGPYDPKQLSPNNPAFSKTGGDNWLLTMNSKLFINGVFVKDLINEHISPANIWLSADGKRFAIIGFDRIEFSDGLLIKDPLTLRITTDRNQITIWWLSIENEKDITLNSKKI